MKPPKAMLQLTSLLCLLALLVGLGGCGSESETSSRSNPGTSSSGNKAPGQETTGPVLSRSECQMLRRAVEDRESVSAQIESDPSPPTTDCTISGRGLTVSVALNADDDARPEFFNWIAELTQGAAGNPDSVPHPVANLGEPSAGRSTASWVPASGTLYVLRGNRWISTLYGKAGISLAQQKARTIKLTEMAYRFSR